MQLIQIISLKPPTAAEEEREYAAMTRFTDAGKLFFEEHRHDDPPIFLQPGEHYVVQEELADEGFILYPAEKELHFLARMGHASAPAPVRAMPREDAHAEGVHEP